MTKEELASRDFDLGTWLGRRQAFGMLAGKAAAADAECLRRIREQRLYRSRAMNWADFCARYVGASKTQVDRMIRHLEEFGPRFYELTEFTRISPETYRAIAPHIADEGVHLDGQVIAISQENSEQISAAVAELRSRVERRTTVSALPAPEVPAAPEPPPHTGSFEAMEKRFDELISYIAHLTEPLNYTQQVSLSSRLSQLRQRMIDADVRFV